MISIRNHHVAYIYPPDPANGRAFRRPLPCAKTNKYRRGSYVAHSDVRDRHVLYPPAIDRLQREAPTMDKIYVRDRYVFKPAVRFWPEFDASGYAALSGANSCVVLNVPSKKVPRSKPETCEFVIVTFSVARANPSAYELFRTIASSLGEFT